MIENEAKLSNAALKKEKIRQRYKGIDEDKLEVIPAIPIENIYDDQREKRVAVYARVSTDDPRQTSSYELQKNHYQDVVSRHPGWTLTEIYADEGISGTSLQHRDAFLRMIDDCRAGKIDLIITKSVSRFARNILDFIDYVRQLRAMQPPIGVLFETENIYTLDPNSEMSLSFISTLAQEESHTKSEVMNSSIEMRFRRGIFLTPALLGYDLDDNGNLVINEEEAKTVRLIFFLYLYGYSSSEIADILTKLGRPTKLKNTTWSSSSVLGVLQNERHCGDVLARKTWTPNFLDHKSKKNRQDRNQYRQNNHHEAIISRDDFIAVQRLIANAKYGHKGILPVLHVISEGALKGFVSINPRWSGFKAKDYLEATSNINKQYSITPSKEMHVNAGDFDLRGFEIARAQFFSTINKISVTFSYNHVQFSATCVRKFDAMEIEMLIHPHSLLFVLRPASKDCKNSIVWAKNTNNKKIPKPISGAAFLPNIFELLSWDSNCKYRILGTKRQNKNEEIIVFNLRDTEILIPNSSTDIDNEDDCESFLSFDDDIEPLGNKNNVLAYPEEWAYSFGNEYYYQTQASELSTFAENKNWNSNAKGETYNPEPLNVTNINDLKEGISTMINDMKQEVPNE